MSKKYKMLSYVGDMSQIAYAKRVTIEDGKGKGVSLIDINNGSGLQFTIVVDRGLDISSASLNGFNYTYISKTGITSPYLYEEPKLGFLRSFYGGLLTTCGMTYFGAPSTDEGVELGLHGRMTSIPATNISVKSEWINDEYVIKISGEVRESSVFGENIVLRRTITTKMNDNSICIEDNYENEGFDTTPFMILYHSNFGYPFLDEHSIIKADISNTVKSTGETILNINEITKFDKPQLCHTEEVYFHSIKPKENISTVELINPNQHAKMKLQYDNRYLPCFIQWKSSKQGDYVCGLEPSNALTYGRSVIRNREELYYIKSREVKNINLTYKFYKE